MKCVAILVLVAVAHASEEPAEDATQQNVTVLTEADDGSSLPNDDIVNQEETESDENNAFLEVQAVAAKTCESSKECDEDTYGIGAECMGGECKVNEDFCKECPEGFGPELKDGECVEAKQQHPPVSDKCNRGQAIAVSPSKKIVVCRNDASCEKDKGEDCPTGYHLCTAKEYNAYNAGWSFVWGQSGSRTPGLGAIACRGSVKSTSGAGNQAFRGNAGSDYNQNCDYGSANGWCRGGMSWACNEKWAQAACCIDNLKCGDGIYDSALEYCDDGNTINGDGCDNNCQRSQGSGTGSCGR